MPIGSGTLADLARAGYRVLDEPSMQVDLEIHHRADRPGGLAAVLAGLPEGVTFSELLCAGSHGIGLIAGTRTGGSADRAGDPHHGPWLERTAHDGQTLSSFRGADRPNLAFRQEFADRVEGIIVVEDEPKKMLLRHGLAVLDTLVHVAGTAVRAGGAPLLVLQCPAQLPPTNTYADGGETGGRAGDAARSSSLAVRFEMALPSPGVEARLDVADRIASWCADRGLGLWLRDTRSGYRAGNWFSVLRHDRPRARRGYRRAADRQRSTGNAAEGCVPVTLVGPARSGSTHAVLSYLAQFPELGVVGCTMVPLGGLAFLTLQLAVNGASRQRLFALNGQLDASRTSAAAEDVLRRLVPLLHRDEAPEPQEHLVGRATDYQIAVGPALPVVADNTVRRVPIWVSWQLQDVPTGVRLPVRALHEALHAVRLGEGDPAVEYLVSRERGVSQLRGKGKLAVSKNVVERLYPGRRGTERLAAELVDAWGAALERLGHSVRPGELSVSEHESWLGRGVPLG
ncbi:hypothetical protein GCM10009836_71990 [Pseudonocardia ailaonensis]|uniref:Uncharacterized protein n=1 Tax=Pseudonocardia ailaonensis TaxID=367279 RepID=A0ABN2NPC8_9PSEU